MRTSRFSVATLGLALCLMLCATATTSAQDSPPSVSELRRENEQLRVRIDELEAQLARSQQSIDQLLEQVRQLNAQVAELKKDLDARREPAEGDTSPEETDSPPQPEQTYADLPASAPFAAPETMFRAVRDSYEEVFGEVTTPFESSDARNRYQRDAEAWSKSLKRSLRSQIEWTIEVRRIITSEREPLTIEYRALDAATRLPYSDRVFTMQVPARFERRILQDRDAKYWQLRGVAGAALIINRERESIGFFDVRPFVGPYVEFGIDLTVSSIVPAPEQADPSTPAPTDDGEPEAEGDAGGGS